MTSTSPEQLREAIAREEARVASLEEERRLARGRLDALRSELGALGTPASDRLLPLISESARPETSAEKVVVFRQLFRGRDLADPIAGTAGAWKGLVDGETLKRHIYADRLVTTRPPACL